ncbi:hypothetical protein ABBQ38_014934 [Trebouxia sp. C0009 RCD-2024]
MWIQRTVKSHSLLVSTVKTVKVEYMNGLWRCQAACYRMHGHTGCSSLCLGTLDIRFCTHTRQSSEFTVLLSSLSPVSEPQAPNLYSARLRSVQFDSSQKNLLQWTCQS